MKKRKYAMASRREWEMMSLIDVIFLLLIFALIVSGGESIGSGTDRDEPSLIFECKDINLGNFPAQKITISAPFDVGNGSGQREIVYRDEPRFANLNKAAFAAEPESMIIDTALIRYKEWSKNQGKSVEAIRIKPTDTTPFIIIDFIIRRCSLLGERVIVLMAEEEVG